MGPLVGRAAFEGTVAAHQASLHWGGLFAVFGTTRKWPDSCQDCLALQSLVAFVVE